MTKQASSAKKKTVMIGSKRPRDSEKKHTATSDRRRASWAV
ncbi:hypothetical protein PR003_g19003 [Phytophthora rubi]|uniref:Uncharacterized protein n=1 Tax=Phytophthora rubi TaxID=129364 RepID=A0A6A4E136_9STRA|nr:hypothetical protein PR003_g19003 [Phytophthora rubi]